MSDFLHWNGWAATFWAAHLLTWGFCCSKAALRSTDQYFYGSSIALAVWVGAYVTRTLSGQMDSPVAYMVIDAVAAVLYMLIARIRGAVWAALCVFCCVAMGVTHLSQHFLNAQGGHTAYALGLNVLTLSILAIINIGNWSAHFDPRRSIDRWFLSRFGHPFGLRSFTGRGVPRMARDCEVDS